jgi:hypothetical protein
MARNGAAAWLIAAHDDAGCHGGTGWHGDAARLGHVAVRDGRAAPSVVDSGSKNSSTVVV